MSDGGETGLTLHQALQNAQHPDMDGAAAATLLDRLLMSHPDAVAVLRQRGMAREAAQNWHGAAEDYARALEILPDDTETMTALARCHLRVNNVIEAKLLARQALDHDPANRDAIMFIRMTGDEVDKAEIGGLARACARFDGGQMQKGIAECKAFAARDADRMDAQVALGRMYWRSGRHIAAMDVCQRILDNAPDCLFAHVLLRQFWLMARSPGHADVYLAEVDRLDPDHRVSAAAFGDLGASLPIKDAPAEYIIRQTPAYARNEERADDDAQDRAAWVDELAASSAMLRTKVQPAFSPEEGPVAEYFPLDWHSALAAATPESALLDEPEIEPPPQPDPDPQPIPPNPPADEPTDEPADEPEQELAPALADEDVAVAQPIQPDDTPPWEETPAPQQPPEPARQAIPKRYKADEWLPAEEAERDPQPADEPEPPPAPAPSRRRLVTPRPRRAAPTPEVLPSPKKKAAENLIEAREAAAHKDYAKAIKLIEVVVNKGKKPRETVTMIEDIIERLNPRAHKSLLSEAYQLLAIAYTQAGRPDDAIEALKRK